MVDRRHKDGNWVIAGDDGVVRTWEEVYVALLMDLRDELRTMRADMASMASTLRCRNFLDIPHKLERIKRNTTKKRKPRVVTPKLRVVR